MMGTWRWSKQEIVKALRQLADGYDEDDPFEVDTKLKLQAAIAALSAEPIARGWASEGNMEQFRNNHPNRTFFTVSHSEDYTDDIPIAIYEE